MRGGEHYPFTFGWSDWTGVCSRDLTGDTVSGPSPMTNDISSPLSYQQPSTWLIHTQAAPPHCWNMSDQLGVSLLSPLSLLSSKRQGFQRDCHWVLKMQWHCAYVCLSVSVCTFWLYAHLWGNTVLYSLYVWHEFAQQYIGLISIEADSRFCSGFS